MDCVFDGMLADFLYLLWYFFNQKQELPVVAMIVNRSGQNEQS
jgi:hypothetical protein